MISDHCAYCCLTREERERRHKIAIFLVRDCQMIKRRQGPMVLVTIVVIGTRDAAQFNIDSRGNEKLHNPEGRRLQERIRVH